MKALLVQPNNRSYVIMPSLGLGYLAAVLRSRGHEAAVLDCLLERLGPKEFGNRISVIAPDVIGFQTFSYDLNVMKDYLAAARTAAPHAVLVAGGPHPSGDPEGALRHLSQLDYAFKGEAEIGFPLLLDYLSSDRDSPAEIPGLVRRSGDGNALITPPAMVTDLDSLPFPAWDLLKPERYPEAPHGAFTRAFPTAPVITSRGCACRCTFCAGKAIHGGRLRTRSLENIMEELRLLKRRGIREFHIEDENFTVNKERVHLFCDMLERQGLGMSWSLPSGVRIDTLDAEMLAAMERAGCYSLALGIEFGSDHIMTLTRKGLDIGRVESQLALLKRRKMKTTGFFLFGIPGETLQEMEETLRYSLHLPLNRAQFNNFIPLPGSVLWEQEKQRGNLEKVEWDRFFVHDVAYTSPGIGPEDIKRLQRKAYLRFYLRPKIILGVLSEIRSWHHFRYLVRRFLDALR